MRVGADHQPMHEAAEHLGGVPDRLAPADLNVIGVEEQRIPTEFMNADFKRHARACAGLGKNHRPSLALEGFLVMAALLLEMTGHRENLHDLLARKIGFLEKMFHVSFGYFFAASTPRTMSVARSSCSRVVISGGSGRTVWVPATGARRPASRSSVT